MYWIDIWKVTPTQALSSLVIEAPSTPQLQYTLYMITSLSITHSLFLPALIQELHSLLHQCAGLISYNIHMYIHVHNELVVVLGEEFENGVILVAIYVHTTYWILSSIPEMSPSTCCIFKPARSPILPLSNTYFWVGRYSSCPFAICVLHVLGTHV